MLNNSYESWCNYLSQTGDGVGMTFDQACGRLSLWLCWAGDLTRNKNAPEMNVLVWVLFSFIPIYIS